METSFSTKLISRIETELGVTITKTQTPPQGTSSQVFFVTTTDGHEYAIKYGKDAMKDVPALELIQQKGALVPVPKLYASFVFEDTPVIVLERIYSPLLESVSSPEMERYIPSMIQTLRELHKINSPTPGFLTDTEHTKTWREILLSIFNGETFDWHEIAQREGVDGDLILRSVNFITEKIIHTEFPSGPYALLHTDFNQRNLFIDPQSDRITAVVDWEEALYGDPLYDFARVRMLMWHFNFSEEAVSSYYELMRYSQEERGRENLYWLSRVIQYLGWYSEELTEFNRGRIEMHQQYLKDYVWIN